MRFATVSGLSGRIVRYTETNSFPDGGHQGVALVVRDNVLLAGSPYSVHTFWIAPDGQVEAVNGSYDLSLLEAEQRFAARVERYEGALT